MCSSDLIGTGCEHFTCQRRIGHFTATGVRSHFSERFRMGGYDLPSSIYEPTVTQ